ncbi:MAG: ExbD/TolR family protein [Bacteriovoracia bacterium]
MKHRRKRHIEGDLNINALMDVLTVLLFFLIQSYTVSTTAITPPKGMRLPASTSMTKIEESVSVSLSATELRANNQLLLKLHRGQLSPIDLGEDQRTITVLKSFLEKEYRKKNQIYEGAGDLSFLPAASVLVQADKDLPFALVKHVLNTVATVGYKDYQFVVQNDKK